MELPQSLANFARRIDTIESMLYFGGFIFSGARQVGLLEDGPRENGQPCSDCRTLTMQCNELTTHRNELQRKLGETETALREKSMILMEV